MGKGTMVCGDTLMFNHKLPPSMLVLTSPLHYSSLRLSKEFIAPLLHPPLTLQPQSNPWDDSVTWGKKSLTLTPTRLDK